MAKKRLPPEVLEFFRNEGKKGGRLGGLKRAANLTPERRSEIARLAVAAREAKRKALGVSTAGSAAVSPAKSGAKPRVAKKVKE